MILLISLTIFLASIGYLIHSLWIMKIEEKLTKITVNHHGRMKNLEEKQVNSWENIHDEIAKTFFESGEKTAVYKK